MKFHRIQVCALSSSAPCVVAMALDRVPAGCLSPSQGYLGTKIDLSEMWIRDQISTFIVWVSGKSIQGASISDGVELIVERSIQPRDGHVIVAVIDGEKTVKGLSTSPTGVVLKPANPEHSDLPLAEYRQEYITHVDVNSFYVSCEWVFDPTLENRPVIVLSFNDGCAVERSSEAKALGIGWVSPGSNPRQALSATGR